MPSSASRVTEVRFDPAPGAAGSTGLLGWIRFRLGPLRLDGIALRRSRDGRTYLAFPERRTSRGAFPYMAPPDRAARIEIEGQVFAALGLDQEPTP